MQVVLQDQAFGLFEEMVSCRGGIVPHSPGGGPRGEMASQGQHGIDKQGRTVLGLASGGRRRLPLLEFFHELVLGQGGEEAVVPAKVHVDEVAHKVWVGGDGGPRGQGVVQLRIVVDGGQRVGRVFGTIAGAHVNEMRSAADVARRAVLQAQFAHLAAQLRLECGWGRGGGQRAGLVDVFVIVVRVVAVLPGDDGLGDDIEALAGADLLHERGDLVLRVVEDGLDQGLQGRVAGLEALDVLFVDALAAVVRVWVVDALGVVDGGAGRAGRRGAVALRAAWTVSEGTSIN